MRSGISSATYGRLVAPDVLSHHRSLLYLDGDMLVDGDISELTSSPPAHFAAVEALHHISREPELYRQNPNLPRPPSYFNAGLCHIDVATWRDSDTTRRAMEIISDESVTLPLHDQDALNILFGDTYQRLDSRWNFTWPMSHIVPGLRPFVAHFAGRLKPWDPEEWRCPRVFRTAYIGLFSEMPASITESLVYLQFSDEEKKALRRQRVKRSVGLDQSETWNSHHASVLENWCSSGE